MGTIDNLALGLNVPRLDEMTFVVAAGQVGPAIRDLDVDYRVHEARSASHALELAQYMTPAAFVFDADVADVSLEEISSRIAGRSALILISADDGIAERASSLGALAVLGKPLYRRRLFEAAQAVEKWTVERERALAAKTARTPGAPASSAKDRRRAKRWLRITRNEALVVSPLNDVVYFQAERKYTRVALASIDGVLHRGINTVAEDLDRSQFWRIHRSIIVNGRFVSDLQRDEFGRLGVHLRGRKEVLHASKSHEAELAHDGIF